MKNIRLIAILFISITIIGCTNYPCHRAECAVYFAGFSQNELDSILIKKLNKGQQITLDSCFLFNSVHTYNYQSTDSFSLFNYCNGFYGLVSDYDYEINIMSIHKKYSIKEIIEEQHSLRKSFFVNTKEDCVNLISSYKLNDSFINATNYDNSIFISK